MVLESMAEPDVLVRYRTVVEAFVAKRLTARAFSDAVWELFKRDRDVDREDDWGDDYEMLNTLVLAAEAFDEDALEEDSTFLIGETELRESAEHALLQLDAALRARE